MRRSLLTLIAVSGFVAISSFGAWADEARMARPGSINYVEGKASIGTQELGPNSPGLVELGKDQTLTTEAGKVEILLTPGVFLRVDDFSSVRMVSPSLASIAMSLSSLSVVGNALRLRKVRL